MVGRRSFLVGAGVLGVSGQQTWGSKDDDCGWLQRQGIARRYDADAGIEHDPAVIFVEDFETDNVLDILNRWSDHKNPESMAIDTDVPRGSRGRSLRFGRGSHLYHQLPQNYNRVYLRYYAKYSTPSDYHHSGVWLGGYNPPLPYPFPRAGELPAGDDRFSAGVEPLSGLVSAPDSSMRFDFYNYWMRMRTNPDGRYWGNDLINDPAVVVPSGTWTCVEIMVKMNQPVDGYNGELALWVNGRLITHLKEGCPRGYWVWDSFHPDPYAPPFEGFQWRNIEALAINYIWLQNFITGDLDAPLWFDHVVMAKKYIGPLHTAIRPIP